MKGFSLVQRREQEGGEEGEQKGVGTLEGDEEGALGSKAHQEPMLHILRAQQKTYARVFRAQQT